MYLHTFQGAAQPERAAPGAGSGTSHVGVWVCATVALFVLAATAHAQPSSAQQRYDSQVAQCNRAGLPAPQREACLRDAGRQLDSTNGGVPPALVPRTSADGRAEVMAPPGAPPPASGPQFVTSPDGRAVLGVPPGSDRLERP
ncbi:MAG: hypothetical protein EOO29_38255 [Comamonadaceae bacterium]|nr:MAG: hypothetical protein EOO29_38255 [Comamonadaceae bacterium]